MPFSFIHQLVAGDAIGDAKCKKLAPESLYSLGLSKLYKTVELPDNAATAGALRKVAPYVKVEEV